MTPLIEKFIHSKLENIELTFDSSGDILGTKNDNKFFLYKKEKDTLFFDFSDFKIICSMFEISNFRCVKHIKDCFSNKFDLKFSIFLPILGTGIYWYDLECYV